MKKLSKTTQWVLAATVGAVFFMAVNYKSPQKEKPYSEFVQDVQSGKISQVNMPVDGFGAANIHTKNNEQYVVMLPKNDQIVSRMLDQGVSLKAEQTKSSWGGLLWSLLPTFLLIGFFYWMTRSQGGAGNGAGNANNMIRKVRKNGISQASEVRLDEVKGCDNAKREVAEIIEYMKNPDQFIKVGAKMPRGVLMAGPPGTGKTMLARAIATEAGAEFISRSGSDFVEMFVGVGASRVRDLFDEARNAGKPAIIFIDEIDAVGKARSNGGPGSNDERESTLNQLLVEMDGMNQNENIFVIAATNRPDALDEALRRPGRFDREVQIDLPDVKGRLEILKSYMKELPLGLDVDIHTLAQSTQGFSGAELSNLCNEAAIFAGREKSMLINRTHFEHAMDKVMMGVERNMRMSDDERSDTAYHEVGHAVVGMVLQKDPVHKVSIIPRGRALGVTMQIPDKERYSYSRKFAKNHLAMLLGGRAAEELYTKDITSGASDDIRRASELANNMVTKWGMSDAIGLQHFDLQRQVVGDAQMRQINDEVNGIIAESYELAKNVLKTHNALVEEMTAMLLEKETLNRPEIDKLFEKHGIEVPKIENIFQVEQTKENAA